MSREKNVALTDVYSLFHCAVSEMEAGHKLWRKKEYGQFVSMLQTSATYLAKALLEVNGRPVSDEKSLAKQVIAADDKDNSIHHVYNTILDVLSFDARKDENREKLEDVYGEYRSSLINARKILVSELGYNEKIWKKLRQLFLTRAGMKPLAVVILPVFILLTLPVLIYHYVDPIDSFEIDGQLFWKSKPKVPFSTKNSIRFPVISDNQSREYTIALDSPVNIFLLRLDPVNTIGLTDIEIELIRLHGTDDALLKEIVFDNSMYWACDNCVGLEKRANTYRLRPSSNDPFLTSSAINQEGVKKITVKMRAVSEKTFWEWILGIDKEMEF